MYQKYQTDALVLQGRELGEADKMYALFTRDFGLVRARASAVRTEGSKMRYALQSFSYLHASLVRGKRGWRVAGVRALRSAPHDVRVVAAIARISELVLKLVTGEERNEYLFHALSGAHDALCKGEESEMIEILAVARLLYALGYISNESLQSALFSNNQYSQSALEETVRLREKLLEAINHALTETHLVRT